jgi:hypothetical protein
MKAVFAIAVAAALVSMPAAADNQNQSNSSNQSSQFSERHDPQVDGGANGGWSRNLARQCFNGKSIAGVNRSGAQTVYIQAHQGSIYQMRLVNDCEGLNGAEKLSVRASGSDLVCPGDNAELVARIAAASKHCRVTGVRRLTAKEVSALASATH